MKIAFLVLICLLVVPVIYGYNALMGGMFEEGTEIVVYDGNTAFTDPKRNVCPMGGDPIENPIPH